MAATLETIYMTPEWYELRQCEYDRRMAECGAKDDLDPASDAMWVQHGAVVAEIDKLPIAEGGKR